MRRRALLTSVAARLLPASLLPACLRRRSKTSRQRYTAPAAGQRLRHSPADASGVQKQTSTKSTASFRPRPATSAAGPPNPTYDSVSAGNSGHAEAVQVVFDPSKVTYSKLLEYYWRTIDPTTKDRQFCDSGSPYRTAIFTHDEQQRALAEASKESVEQQQAVSRADRHRDRQCNAVLSRRGLSPGLSHQESGAIQVLPHQLRTRRAAEATMGISGAAVALHRWSPAARLSTRAVKIHQRRDRDSV